MGRKLITGEVAEQLGITHNTLGKFLNRNKEFLPAEKLPSGEYLWADDEIEAVRLRRLKRKPRTVKKKVAVVEPEPEAEAEESEDNTETTE